MGVRLSLTHAESNYSVALQGASRGAEWTAAKVVIARRPLKEAIPAFLTPLNPLLNGQSSDSE